jgi:hypothetical protein
MSSSDHLLPHCLTASSGAIWILVSWQAWYNACFPSNDHWILEIKILDSALIVAGILVAITSSWCVSMFVVAKIDCSYPRLVYRFMQKHIRQLEEFPEETDRLAADAIEDVEEGAPLLRNFSDDSVGDMQAERAHSPRSL